jgi:hypothetical protein
LIVTGGGLSFDGKRWIQTDPRFLKHYGGFKKRWKYHVCTRMKKDHREDQWRFLSEPEAQIQTFPQTVSAFCINDQQAEESNLVRLYWGLAA